MARNLSSLIALVAFAGTAVAQSKRYPEPPKDADKEAESHSVLWESALDPSRRPYDDATREARRLLDLTTDKRANAQAALDKLDPAIKLLPKEPKAYLLRGEAELVLEKWDKCADDLVLAELAPAATIERDRQQLELGICQARAGRLADAERTLVHAVSLSPRGEQWMRLGEVRIALGKLDEAIDALSAALEAGDAQRAATLWLRALAYDRARHTTESDVDATQAFAFDSGLNAIEHPQYPYIATGEKEYLYGLAYRVKPNANRAQPEVALAYFREFLRVAPDSPWHRRAAEHVKELAATEFPQYYEASSPNTVVDPPAMLAAIKRSMPAMRACVAKTPGDVFGVYLVRNGPVGSPAFDRPVYGSRQPTSTTVKVRISFTAVPAATEDAAMKCVKSIAERLPVPPPKEHDTYYSFSFIVVAP